MIVPTIHYLDVNRYCRQYEVILKLVLLLLWNNCDLDFKHHCFCVNSLEGWWNPVLLCRVSKTTTVHDKRVWGLKNFNLCGVIFYLLSLWNNSGSMKASPIWQKKCGSVSFIGGRHLKEREVCKIFKTVIEVKVGLSPSKKFVLFLWLKTF